MLLIKFEKNTETEGDSSSLGPGVTVFNLGEVERFPLVTIGLEELKRRR